MIDTSADLGVESIVLGMSHRGNCIIIRFCLFLIIKLKWILTKGRLNVLANVVRKPLDSLLHEFDVDGQKDHFDDLGFGTGDVKYHLGTSYDRPTVSGKTVHLSLLANPSHLEAVDPVVEGKARAKQHYLNDADRSKVLPVLIHGEAAFAGQVFLLLQLLGVTFLPNSTQSGSCF